MNVKIKSPFKPDKVARFLGQEGDLAKLQAIAAFSMPGINLQPGDKFCTPIEDVIFPESVEHEQMAEGTRIALCNDLSALRSENARLREALQAIAGCVKCAESENPTRSEHLPEVVDGWIDHASALLAKLEE